MQHLREGNDIHTSSSLGQTRPTNSSETHFLFVLGQNNSTERMSVSTLLVTRISGPACSTTFGSGAVGSSSGGYYRSTRGRRARFRVRDEPELRTAA